MRVIRGCAPWITWLLVLVFVSGTSDAATGSFGVSAFVACVRHHSAFASASSSRDAVGDLHPRPSVSVAVVTPTSGLANAFFYSSASLARAGEQSYVADMVNLACSAASAKLRRTCTSNIRGETQPLVRYTVANVFVQFKSEHPSAQLRGVFASCLHG